jgi:hypothetical protein
MSFTAPAIPFAIFTRSATGVSLNIGMKPAPGTFTFAVTLSVE